MSDTDVLNGLTVIYGFYIQFDFMYPELLPDLGSLLVWMVNVIELQYIPGVVWPVRLPGIN
jgi:hypothetical protein